MERGMKIGNIFKRKIAMLIAGVMIICQANPIMVANAFQIKNKNELTCVETKEHNYNEFKNNLGFIDEATLSNANNSNNSEKYEIATPSDIKLQTDTSEIIYSNEIDNYMIYIYAEEGIFPENTKTVIKKVELIQDKYIEEIVNNNLQEGENLALCVAFDISFYHDGFEIQPPNGSVQVSIKLISDLEIKTNTIAKVFRIENGDSIEEIYAESFEEKNVIYQADHFSVFAVALVETNYVPIYTAEDLHKINVNLNGHYILMNDIDLSGWGEWEPIGNNDEGNRISFNGIFDGNGHTITNLSIDVSGNSDSEFKGFFGNAEGGTIKNLIISNAKITGIASAVSQIGIIAGRGGIISNCNVNGSINVTSDTTTLYTRRTIGGIAGNTQGKLEFCSSDVEITVNQMAKNALSVGGIVGENSNDVMKAVNYGRIEVKSYCTNGWEIEVGGISGDGASKITQCANYGNIGVDVSHEGEVNFEIENVTLVTHIGGISGGSTIIENCFNSGRIAVKANCVNTGKRGYAYAEVYVGGILGECANKTTIIDNCYNVGLIVCESNVQSLNSDRNVDKNYVGGIIGSQSLGKSGNCYYSNTADKGIGNIGNNSTILTPCTSLFLLEMEKQESFDTFDFDTIWKMGERNYPFPVLQWIKDISQQPEIPDEPEIPDKNQPLTIVSVFPQANATGIKTTDRIMIEFNRKVNSGYEGDNSIYIKDYDTDEVIYKTNMSYFGMTKIFIDNALKECTSSKCYIYIPENAFYTKQENQETGEITLEFFEGIKDKDEYSFCMENNIPIFMAIFDSNGGNRVGNRSFQEGSQIKRPNDPYRTGYDFIGWFTDKNCTIAFDFNTLVYNNITLYAGWNVNKNSFSDEDTSTDEKQVNYNYSDNWKQSNGYWQCYDKNGNKYIGYKEGLYWNGIKGNWFFGQDGNMQTGWHEGKYFNETSNGYNGIEITNTNLVNYTQRGDASSTIGQYSYAVIFVDDIDSKTKLNSSVKNYQNEFKSIIVGLWNTITTNQWDIAQNIVDAYMKDSVSNKAFLADIVNEMFSTETWRNTWDGAKTLNFQVSAGSTTETYINELWKNVEEGVGNELDATLIRENGWGTLKTLLNSSEEVQKMFTDYTQNIVYLESLKSSVSFNSVLQKAIDELIDDYKTQSETSLSKVIINVLKINNIDNDYTKIANIFVSDDAWGEIGKMFIDEVVGLNVGKVDKIIQLAYTNISGVSPVDKVVYSSYLRYDAIRALKNAEEKVKSKDNIITMEEYKNAFECARLMTIAQYENMLKYYKDSPYNKTDKNIKIDYLEGELAKLEEMTFINYINKSSKAYYDYVASK